MLEANLAPMLASRQERRGTFGVLAKDVELTLGLMADQPLAGLVTEATRVVRRGGVENGFSGLAASAALDVVRRRR